MVFHGHRSALFLLFRTLPDVEKIGSKIRPEGVLAGVLT